MGISSGLKIRELISKLRKKENHNNEMAFYIYEQPTFSIEHFHPAFYQPLRSVSRPRHWNLLENLFEQESKACQSNQSCDSTRSMKKSLDKSSNSTSEDGKMEVKVDQNNDMNKSVEPVIKNI